MVFEFIPLFQHTARMQQRLETAVRPSPPEKTGNGIVFVGQFLIDEG